MVRASDFYSSQPSSSQFLCDEEAVERAFWQSTPTALEELRQRTGTDDECHQAPSNDQDRPDDPLSLSTEQSKLIRQTWTSAARLARTSDGEPRTSSRHEYRNRRGEAAGPASTITSAVLSSDKTVDERMQKRKIQKEWSTKLISETARLRDEANLENMNVHDTFDDERPGTPRSEPVEEVPTSQSQERYLSISHLSQTGFISAPYAPIDDSHVGVAVTSVKSPGPVTNATLSEDPAARPDLSSRCH